MSTGLFEKDEDSTKNQNLEDKYENWSFMKAKPGELAGMPAYKFGGIDKGMGKLELVETPEMDQNYAVVYEFFTEGDSEPLSNVLDGKPDIHTVDLPYNQFDEVYDAFEYMRVVVDKGLENILSEYGVNPAVTRNP